MGAVVDSGRGAVVVVVVVVVGVSDMVRASMAGSASASGAQCVLFGCVHMVIMVAMCCDVWMGVYVGMRRASAAASVCTTGASNNEVFVVVDCCCC